MSEVQVSPTTKAARDLTEIVELATRLHSEAHNRANAKLDGTSIPGGLAMVSITPVANIEAWEHRYEAAERYGRPTDHVEEEDAEWEPVLQTLRFWTDRYRRIHAAEWDHIPTIHTEASFLRHNLNWAWENDEDWDHLAADVREARLRLENILHAGIRAERTRVPCTNEVCERRPRLIRVYANAAVEDHYKCTTCKHRYDQPAFARAKLQHLDSEGADRHVKVQDARDAIDRPARTWGKWLRYWHVRSYRDGQTGQVWVWWPDVRDADVSTPRRKRAS